MALFSIDLSSNAVHSVAPDAFQGYNVALDFSNNSLSAGLAPGAFAGISSAAVDVSLNGLTSLPQGLLAFSTLSSLNVSHNALTVLPASLFVNVTFDADSYQGFLDASWNSIATVGVGAMKGNRRRGCVDRGFWLWCVQQLVLAQYGGWDGSIFCNYAVVATCSRLAPLHVLCMPQRCVRPVVGPIAQCVNGAGQRYLWWRAVPRGAVARAQHDPHGVSTGASADGPIRSRPQLQRTGTCSAGCGVVGMCTHACLVQNFPFRMTRIVLVARRESRDVSPRC